MNSLRLKPTKEHIALFIATSVKQGPSIDKLERFVIPPEPLLSALWTDTPVLFFCRTCATPQGTTYNTGLTVSCCPKCKESAYDFNESFLLSRHLCRYQHATFNNLYSTFLGAVWYRKLDYAELRKPYERSTHADKRSTAAQSMKELFG